MNYRQSTQYKNHRYDTYFILDETLSIKENHYTNEPSLKQLK